MKKIVLLIISMFLLSIFSLALVHAEENDDNKRILDEDEKPVKPMMYKVHFMGKGLAVDPSNLDSFKGFSIAAGKVALTNRSLITRGLLKFSDKNYILSEMVVESNKASSKILDSSTKSEVGSLSLTLKKEDNGLSVWYGKATIDGKDWQLYILGVHRDFSVEELADKARDYCKDNPADERCKAVAGYYCKENPAECSAKIVSYCKDHATDTRCKALLNLYCTKHADDDRCKAAEPTTTGIRPKVGIEPVDRNVGTG